MSSSTALAVKQDIEKGLLRLRAEAEAITVTDQAQYISAAQIENDVNAYIKDVKAKLGPGIDSAKQHLDRLRNDMAAFITPAEAIRETVKSKRLRFAEEEKRKAEAEQRRLNEERRIEAQRVAEAERKERERLAAEQRERDRKEIEAARRAGDVGKREAERLKKEADERAERERIAAAEDAKLAAANVQEVQVKAAVPTVAGIKNQTFFFCEVTDPDAIIRDFLAGDAVRRGFLRQFITINEQAVGKFARDTKDNAKASKLVPGCRFWSKG